MSAMLRMRDRNECSRDGGSACNQLSGLAEAVCTTGTLRVAAFTGSLTVSSRRFRVAQYIPKLRSKGICVDENVARLGSWPPQNRFVRPLWFAGTVLDRVIPVLRSHVYDVTLLQRELVSTFATLERFTHRPRVLDVDDAIWLAQPRSARAFAALAKMSDAILCGNTFIAEAARQWNANVTVLPTAVDTNRFFCVERAEVPSKKIVGWSGLQSGLKYLLGVERALYRLLTSRSNTVLRIVSDAMPKFERLRPPLVEFVKWSPENEVQTIQEMNVGLMPIDDTLWSRGKCSYKMLLYMACGVPVVVSPFGMNREVLSYGDVGFGAITDSDWIDAIGYLLDNPERAREMGQEGRRVVEENFSLDILADRMASCLKAVGGRRSRNIA